MQAMIATNDDDVFVNFNQDCTSLVVGSRSGYRIFSLQQLDPNGDGLECIFECKGEEIRIIERLYSSSLVALVTFSAPRLLRVLHFRKNTEICNYSYSDSILAVKLNRVRLIVCLEGSIFIHNIRSMNVMHTIRDTPPNPHGLFALSASSDHCFVAYPGSSNTGEVQIFDAINLKSKTMIPAHQSPLAAIAFDLTGTKLATASEKGTVIRVYAVEDGTRLYEFRRGVKRYVNMSSLTFSTDSQYLCCSSNTETVHVFKLEEFKEEARAVQEESSWMDYLSTVVSASATYLPQQVTDVFNQGRDFATAHLPVTGVKNTVAITTIQRVQRVLVACSNGILYVYDFDAPAGGGDLKLIKMHRLDECEEIDTVVKHLDAVDVNAAVSAVNANVQGPNNSIASYAGILKGNPPGSVSGSDADVAFEISKAVDLPPKGVLRLDDAKEFPSVAAAQ